MGLPTSIARISSHLCLPPCPQPHLSPFLCIKSPAQDGQTTLPLKETQKTGRLDHYFLLVSNFSSTPSHTQQPLCSGTVSPCQPQRTAENFRSTWQAPPPTNHPVHSRSVRIGATCQLLQILPSAPRTWCHPFPPPPLPAPGPPPTTSYSRKALPDPKSSGCQLINYPSLSPISISSLFFLLCPNLWTASHPDKKELNKQARPWTAAPLAPPARISRGH